MLEMDEASALQGQTVEVVAVGVDAFAFKTGDGRTLMATLCLGCGSHLGYYEIDPDLLDTTGGDIAGS
jgi:hypothetical protein